MSSVIALESQHVLQTYRRAPVVFARGEGCYLWDTEGRRYLDLISGVGVASLGHANPVLAAAVAEQASTLLHTSNLYYHPLQGEVAARLAALSGLPRTFFCNSGTEANEACLKFARRYWHTQGDTGRTRFVALEHAFHGRTFGSLSVTWDSHYRDPFAPLVGGVTFVSPDDPAGLAAAVDGSVAAITLEAIQGEGGVRPLSPAFADAVREVRGAGLMWGIDLQTDAAPYVRAALDGGVLINRTSDTVIRLLPPFILSKAQADDVVERLDALFTKVAKEQAA
jgi:acetylornithine aminotransferase/acetylornithine/N-succinyldiaminopimelate aminotransferase